MCGIDDAIKYLRTIRPERKEDADKPKMIINRLEYHRAQAIGVRPKFHKGQYGKKYDSWSCGNCGRTLSRDVLANYCDGCGYRVLWDSPRCVTGKEGAEDGKSE